MNYNDGQKFETKFALIKTLPFCYLYYLELVQEII